MVSFCSKMTEESLKHYLNVFMQVFKSVSNRVWIACNFKKIDEAYIPHKRHKKTLYFGVNLYFLSSLRGKYQVC